jgi:hypothetical protein
MGVGRPWTVKFKEGSISVFGWVLGFLATIIKGVGNAFFGGFGAR